MSDLFPLEHLINADRVREQLRLDYGVSASTIPSTPTPPSNKERTGPDVERQALALKYASRITDRLEFGSLCTYVPNKRLPVFRWFKYKEGFSRALVERLLKEEWDLPLECTVLDPFAGSGTTLLACQQLGYRSIGTEIMPISVFVSRVKLNANYLLLSPP